MECRPGVSHQFCPHKEWVLYDGELKDIFQKNTLKNFIFVLSVFLAFSPWFFTNLGRFLWDIRLEVKTHEDGQKSIFILFLLYLKVRSESQATFKSLSSS